MRLSTSDSLCEMITFGVTNECVTYLCFRRTTVALPHENLPLSASSSSFPPTLHWSLLQDCIFAHGLSRWRSIWHSLERKRKIFHEATRGRSLSPSQTDHQLCFSRGEENGKVVGKCSNRSHVSIVKQRRHRNGRCSMPLSPRLATSVATPGGCSIMPKRYSSRTGAHSFTSMDRTSNMHSFWLGMPPTASAPNGSSLFSLP